MVQKCSIANPMVRTVIQISNWARWSPVFEGGPYQKRPNSGPHRLSRVLSLELNYTSIRNVWLDSDPEAGTLTGSDSESSFL